MHLFEFILLHVQYKVLCDCMEQSTVQMHTVATATAVYNMHMVQRTDTKPKHMQNAKRAKVVDPL